MCRSRRRSIAGCDRGPKCRCWRSNDKKDGRKSRHDIVRKQEGFLSARCTLATLLFGSTTRNKCTAKSWNYTCHQPPSHCVGPGVAALLGAGVRRSGNQCVDMVQNGRGDRRNQANGQITRSLLSAIVHGKRGRLMRCTLHLAAPRSRLLSLRRKYIARVSDRFRPVAKPRTNVRSCYVLIYHESFVLYLL